MADISPAIVKINDLEVAFNKPTSEALFSKIGANINALIDQDASFSSTIATLTSRVNTAQNIFIADAHTEIIKDIGTRVNWNDSSGFWKVTRLFESGGNVQTEERYDTGILSGPGNHIPLKWVNAIPDGTSDNYFVQFRLLQYDPV